jgi:hypothetical protein
MDLPEGQSLIDAALRVYAAEIGAKDFRTERMGLSAEKAAVRRVVFSLPGGNRRSTVVKCCGQYERLLFAFVHQEMPRLVPALLSVYEPPEPLTEDNRDVCLMMEDLSESGYIQYGPEHSHCFSPSGLLHALAALHTHFAGLPELPSRGAENVRKVLSEREVSAIPGLLTLVLPNQIERLDSRAMSSLDEAARLYAQFAREASAESWLTLVHGDFHQENVFFGGSDDVRIVDWAMAHIDRPQYDLVFFDAPLVMEEYLAKLPPQLVPDERAFLRCLRAVTVERMFAFLQSCLQVALWESDSPGGALLVSSVPVYVDRLLRALDMSGLD